MRHPVNLSLLLCFGVLMGTGILAYTRPFSLTVSSLHILAAAFMIILAGIHIFERLGYFKRLMSVFKSKKGPVSQKKIVLIAALAAMLVCAALFKLPPATTVTAQSYEARQRANIVRASSLTGFSETLSTKMIARGNAKPGDYAVSLHVGFNTDLPKNPSIVVWAETTTGAMIETLYIEDGLAYSDKPEWGGRETPRNHIFPVWRNRYTLVSGVDPEGEFDAETGTTASHTFSLSDYVSTDGASTFIIFAEVNLPADVNRKYDDAHIGQPSLLYSALVKPGGSPYSIMKLTGHGGGAQKSGAIQYDLGSVTTAKDLVDLLLLDVRRTEVAP